MNRDSATKRKIDNFESSPASTSIQEPNSSRCTRSQAVPDWTTHETLVLASEIAAMDEDWLKALSTYQKWKIISDNCIASDVVRSSSQCKRKWESLLADYKKIRNWESKHGEGSYWSLKSERKRLLELPFSFDQEVFGVLEAVIEPQEAQAGSADSDSEELIVAEDDPDDPIMNTDVKMMNADTILGTEKKAQGDTYNAWCISNKLQEDAQRIQYVLSGQMEENVDIEFTGRQANQLIKSLGSLVGNLDDLSELIKSGKYERIRFPDSMAL